VIAGDGEGILEFFVEKLGIRVLFAVVRFRLLVSLEAPLGRLVSPSPTAAPPPAMEEKGGSFIHHVAAQQ
jgi:hypothetical protein